MTEKEFDFVAKCRDAYVTAKARECDDALVHCAGEIVEACNARAAYKFKKSEANAKWFQDELADIAICILSKWGYRNTNFPDGIKMMVSNIKHYEKKLKEDDFIEDNLKECTKLFICYGNPYDNEARIFVYAKLEFKKHFPQGDFFQAITDKMERNKSKVW